MQTKPKPYTVTVKCGCCKGSGQLNKTIQCFYCKGTGKREESRPHPSHKMSRYRSEIIAPCGTPRFYSVRHCTQCKKEEWKHAAGHFLHGLGFECKGKSDE